MIGEIMLSIGSIMSQLFAMLDSVYIESDISFLDASLALSYFAATVYFISDILDIRQQS